MATKAKPKPDDPAQFERFKQAAKEAGIDASADAAEQAFKRIVPEKRKPA